MFSTAKHKQTYRQLLEILLTALSLYYSNADNLFFGHYASTLSNINEIINNRRFPIIDLFRNQDGVECIITSNHLCLKNKVSDVNPLSSVNNVLRGGGNEYHASEVYEEPLHGGGEHKEGFTLSQESKRNIVDELSYRQHSLLLSDIRSRRSSTLVRNNYNPRRYLPLNKTSSCFIAKDDVRKIICVDRVSDQPFSELRSHPDPISQNNDMQDGQESSSVMNPKKGIVGQFVQYCFPRLGKTTPKPNGIKDSNRADVFRKKENPFVYRYFGRLRDREDSLPFIVFGPRIDDWKRVGKILASRGFNVMTCERVNTAENKSGGGRIPKEVEEEEDTYLVLTILNALKWKRAILVGCDTEVTMAIEAATKLAPDRVAGLVLCGDLSGTQEYMKNTVINSRLDPSSPIGTATNQMQQNTHIHLDIFLRNRIDCPSTIVWDGNLSTLSSTRGKKATSSPVSIFDDMHSEIAGTSIILGGGSAPHIRLPDQCAWVLTRFVEEKIFFKQKIESLIDEENSLSYTNKDGNTKTQRSKLPGSRSNQGTLYNLMLPREVNELLETIFSRSLVVSGRVIAAAIIYISIARATIFQYKNIRMGIVQIKSSYLSFPTWKKQLGFLLCKVKKNISIHSDSASTPAGMGKGMKVSTKEETSENNKLEEQPSENRGSNEMKVEKKSPPKANTTNVPWHLFFNDNSFA